MQTFDSGFFVKMFTVLDWMVQRSNSLIDHQNPPCIYIGERIRLERESSREYAKRTWRFKCLHFQPGEKVCGKGEYVLSSVMKLRWF